MVRIHAGQPRKRSSTSRGSATREFVEIIPQLNTKKATPASTLEIILATLRIGLLNIGFVIDQFPRSTISRRNRSALFVLR